MKNILSILLCVFTWISLSAQTAKYLKPLNEVLFGEKLNQAITRKTFAQLQQTSQLAHLSQAEKTLLLTHKFIEEHQRWPRTKIVRNGQEILPAQYTPEEAQEIEVGRLLRRTLETNPQTPAPIRKELMDMKRTYSVKYNNMHVLDQLDVWLSARHTWPRLTIKHEGPLTPDEQFEMELARQVNKISRNQIHNVPQELVQQIQEIRASYDLSYIPPSYDKTTENLYTLLEEVQQWLSVYHTWPNSYSANSVRLATRINKALNLDPEIYPLVLDLANLKARYSDYPAEKRPELTAPTPSMPEIPEIDYTQEDQLYQLLSQLEAWTSQQGTWPKMPTGPQKAPKTASPEEIAEWTLAQQASKALQLDHHNSLAILGIAMLKEHYLPTNAKAESELHLDESDYPKQAQSFFSMSKISFLRFLTLQKFMQWVQTNQRWPRTQITRGNATPETYSPQEQEEIVLAIWAELFAQYAHPTQAGRWHTKSAFSSQEILSAPSTYTNQELEMLRLLYRQFSTK